MSELQEEEPIQELSVRFTSDEKVEDSPIGVALFWPQEGTSTDPVPFVAPLKDTELAELRWYLEVFTSWPTATDDERVRRIEAGLEGWGRRLLQSILDSTDAARLWQQFVDEKAEGKLLTIDATDPRVLRLPWELLAEEGGHVFSSAISVRRRLRKVTRGTTREFSLPVRVLLVVARPEGVDFFDPRADAAALLDALQGMGERATVEFLYPPTLEALSKRLRSRRAPPVHVVHFDGHGVYDRALGLGYLLFEDKKHEADRVDATRLGTLLHRCGVPLMMLSACQSAKQEEANPYGSVAARLIQSGVGSVLAMNYAVLVTAAKRFVAAFYEGLVEGQTVGQAVDAGRRALLADEKRGTIIREDAAGKAVEQALRLRDWFLPALYQQVADPVVFPSPPAPLPATAGERGVPSPPTPLPQTAGERGARRGVPRALVDADFPGGLPAQPLHGFHGRAKEMLQLERALAERAVVVLHGMGGMGKTALAAEAGRWFHRTGRFPGGAAFVSFERGGSLQQLCSWVGQAVSDDPNWTLGEGDAVQRIGQLLQERPALVILDNFESVLGKEPLMPADELKTVLDAVWSWARGGAAGQASRVLITTRDTGFNDARFAPSRQCQHVELGGLIPAEALELAAQVLDDHGIERAAVKREDLLALMAHLGGHPLSLYLVLPHLRQRTAAELMAEFEALLPGFTAGAAVERNESLTVSLEFSLRRLGEATRAALPDLAVFQGAAFEDDLLAITGMDEELWKTARAELEGAALVTAESLPGVGPPFLRFHPTLVPYLAARLPAARRAELEERYWKRYYALSRYLYREDTPHPHQARAIAVREMPNLRRALELAIAAGESEVAVDFADNIARFLDVFGRWREREAMMARVAGLGVAGGAGLTQAEFLLRRQEGESLLQAGRAAEAEKVFRELLAGIEAGAAYGAAYDHALTLSWLGSCLSAQGRPAQAIECHRQALQEFERLSGTSDAAKQMLGSVYSDLGDNLRAVGQFNEAQRAYEKGLAISREVRDTRGVGVKLGQLGTLALERGELATAAQRYQEALQTFRALGEPQSEAVIWHQLGMVAEDWEEAERCYREAVRIREQIRDLPMLATDFNQLGIVAQNAGRPGDAERWFLRAQELKEQVAPHDASTLSNLANLYVSQGRLDEAERYARQTLEIDERIGDPSLEVWKDYGILANIAAARGRGADAEGWRRKEQDAFAAYAGAVHEIQRFQPLVQAIVDACRGGEQARKELGGALPKMEAAGQEGARTAAVIRRILAGERELEALRVGLPRVSYMIVRTALGQLAGGTSPPGPSPAREQEGGEMGQALARVREQWGPVIGAVIAACRGNAQARADVERLLQELAGQADWGKLAAALRRVLEGERDPQKLLPGLDGTDMVIVGEVLRGLGAGKAITPEELVEAVGRACRPDAPAGLGAQLWQVTRRLMADPNAPPELQALGRVLNQILAGERQPDLAGLPEEWAEKVREVW